MDAEVSTKIGVLFDEPEPAWGWGRAVMANPDLPGGGKNESGALVSAQVIVTSRRWLETNAP